MLLLILLLLAYKAISMCRFDDVFMIFFLLFHSYYYTYIMGVHSIIGAYATSQLLQLLLRFHSFYRLQLFIYCMLVSKNEKLLLFIYKLFVLLVCKLGYCCCSLSSVCLLVLFLCCFLYMYIIV